jgi:hypothetical protein
VAWCTCTLDAPVGQEGRGDTPPMQGYYGCARRAMLGRAKPQPRLHSVHPRCQGPVLRVGPDPVCGGAVRVVRDQRAKRGGRAVPREADVQSAAVADLQPPRRESAGAGAAMGRRDDARRGPVSPTLRSPLAPCHERPSGLAQAALPRARRGSANTLRSAGLAHGGPP